MGSLGELSNFVRFDLHGLRVNLPFHPPDISGRDARAKLEVAAILAALSEDHPARAALAANRPTADLTYLVDGRLDIREALVASLAANTTRSFAHADTVCTGFGQPPQGLDERPANGQASFCLSCVSWMPGKSPAPGHAAIRGVRMHRYVPAACSTAESQAPTMSEPCELPRIT